MKHKRVGLFGGSFNPVHNGHITLAKAALQHLELDEVWLMVSPLNPFKQGTDDLLPDALRYRMVQLAVQGHKGLCACDVELHLPKPSFTWQTLQALEQTHPDHRFTLLIGGDNWAAFNRWYRSEDLLARYNIAVYPRADSPINTTHLPPNVTILQAQLLPVSSTDIRRRVAQGLSVAHLVPTAVLPLVEKFYAPVGS